MGNTIEVALQWSSSEPSDRKLQSSPVNDWVLKKISDFVTTFENLHELETSFVFRHSLRWNTKISREDLLQTCGFHLSEVGDDVVSDAVDSAGKALITMSTNRCGTGLVMKVRSFKALGCALSSVGNRRHQEVKACIEANPSPVSAILGNEYRPSDGKQLTQQLILGLSQQDNQLHGVDQRIIDQQLAFRIFLLFKQFDEQLLVDVIKLLSNEPKQSPEDVDTVMNSLQQVLKDEPGLIEIVRWTPPYSIVFGNGFRAPFWRQIFGDISYIEVQLKHPCERLFMTASTSGYFVNKGPFNDFGEHDFERKSPLYPDVVTLLRQYNNEVADRVDKELHKHRVSKKQPCGQAKRLDSALSTGSDKFDLGFVTGSQPEYGECIDKSESRCPKSELTAFDSRFETPRDTPNILSHETLSQAEIRQLKYGRGLPVYGQAGSLHTGQDYGDETRSEAELRELKYGRGLPVYGQDQTGQDYGDETRSEAELRELKYGRGLPVYGQDQTGQDYGDETRSEAQLRELKYGRGLPVYGQDQTGQDYGDETKSEAELRELKYGRGLPVYGQDRAASSEGSETASEAEIRQLKYGRGLPVYHMKHDHDLGDEHDDVEEETEDEASRRSSARSSSRLTSVRALPESAGDQEVACKKIVKPPNAGPDKRKSALDAWLEESSSDEDYAEMEDEDGDTRHKVTHQSAADLTVDHWYIQKFIKYIRCGDDSVTVIALCALGDMNLMSERCQTGIADAGGVELLVNLLEASSIKCVVASLKVLASLTTSQQIRQTIKDLGGIQRLLNLLRSPEREVQGLAAENISHFCHASSARKVMRMNNGMMTLVGLLDIDPSHLNLVRVAELTKKAAVAAAAAAAAKSPTPPRRHSQIHVVKTPPWPGDLPPALEARSPLNWRKEVSSARTAALALYKSAISQRNRMLMRREGIMPLIARLLKSDSAFLLIPVVGIVKEFAKEKIYWKDILHEGMVGDLVKTLKNENTELVKYAAQAIYRCAGDIKISNLVRQTGGLKKLVDVIGEGDVSSDLLLAITGAIWKLSASAENVTSFQRLGLISVLINLLRDHPEKVVTRVVGALFECTKVAENREIFYTNGGVQSLLSYQKVTNAALLVNVNNAIANCALHRPSLSIIAGMDGVRLLWSTLKHDNVDVQASAARAICPCIQNIPDSAELVRTLVGGLELLVKLLKSDNLNVLASACNAIATIAAGDEENLAVMSDQGVVSALARLACTTDENLREYLAHAISVCCSHGDNRLMFGKEGIVGPLVGFLRATESIKVQRSTARALYQLSMCAENCVTMHRAGVIRASIDHLFSGIKTGKDTVKDRKF